jgi:hypothetical protein
MSKLLFAILISVVLFYPDFSYSQEQSAKYVGYLSYFLLERQPSPRAESMGRGVFANNENEFSSFYNPAQTSLGRGLDVNFSHSANYLSDNEANYNYIGASYNFKKIGSFSLSRYHMRAFEFTDETGKGFGRQTHSLYTLNYSREIIKDFYAGINLNLLHTSLPSSATFDVKANDVFPVDIGLYKKFVINNAASPYLSQSVQLAGSLYNITGVKAGFDDPQFLANFAFPVTLRLGASYNLEFRKSQDSKMLNVFVHFGYENVLNADTSTRDFYNNVKFGGEVTLLDIFSLRAGYNTKSFETIYSEIKNQFTYGAGVKIPLEKILNNNTPVSLYIDYVNMKQPFPKEFGDMPNFNTIAFRINYIQRL